MPKKMGINSKATEAKERKQAAKNIIKEKAVKDAEDRLWQDDDKNLAKKLAKKEEEERKKQETAKKKAENKQLLEQEMASIKTQVKPAATKITRYQIQNETDKRKPVEEQITATKSVSRISSDIVSEMPLEENTNRFLANTDIARNVDEAIAVLNVSSEDDKHPEKRMRAAFKKFEELNMPRIKKENASLRMSQWQQILMKEWNKSPSNPFNQRQQK